MALVGLEAEALMGWAAENGLGDKPFGEIARDGKTREMISGYVDQLNNHLNRW